MLTQAEVNALLAVRKWFLPGVAFSLPTGKRVYELESDASAERFVLDTWRGTLRLSKVTFQNRARSAIILARLDLGGAPHTNPDGERIECPHLHVYREGYEDKWAFPLDPERFPDPGDLARVFGDFCRFCSIERIPPFQEELL